MAIRYFDGFEDYTAAQQTRYFNAVTASVTITANGRNSGNSMRFSPSTNTAIGVSKTIDSQPTWFIGFAYRVGTILSGDMIIAELRDAGSQQLELRLRLDGTLRITKAGTVLATSTTSLSTSVYYYIEFKATIDPSAGVYELRLNGTTIIGPTTGANTRVTSNSSANQVNLGSPFSSAGGSATNTDYDDVYMADGTSAQDFLGDCRVETKLPTGDGASSQFNRSTGATNFSNVDETTSNDDTDYNNTTASGSIDLYTFPTLSTTSGSIKAVMTVPVMRNDTAGNVTAASTYRSGGTNFFGTTNTVGSTTYTSYTDIQVTDPNTSIAWTVSGVNAAQFGIKRVA